MHRIDALDNVANLFTDGDPTTGTPATVVDAAWLNAAQEEIVNVILGASHALNKADNTQLLTAIRTLLGYSQNFDVIVGAEAWATHATLAAAVADAATGTNLRVLLLDSATLNSTVNLTKAGWRIFAKPGVTYTNGTAATGISCQASGIEISGLRMSGFTTGITGTSAWTYGRILNCNFATCTTDVVDSNSPAGKLPVQIGNITE